ncbi:helix-turn-helix domain-containing protein [Paenibacillus agricola]|uniref:Helix-turn-helix domain-containing protein n=1 Tax=Paenibacillus agricola TaxID=2716264 RepID=A0ABX0J0Y1_9BACL|nr:helix-turn-helix domain-containing protein [Paenibacillus agricola]NHN29900.1 helix-turn-helix domain-containing protein [Paenibacillus agricola]
MRQKKFFFRLFIAYVSIVFVYTLIVSCTFFYKNNEIMQLDLKHRQDTFLREAKNKIDTQLNIVSNLINQLKVNVQVLEYAYNGERNYYLVTSIYNELSKNFDAFSNFGFTIGIGKLEDDLIITPKNTINKASFYKEIGLAPELMDSFSKGTFSKSLILHTTTVSGDRKVTLVKKEPSLDLLFYISFYEGYLLPAMSDRAEAFALIKNGQLVALNGMLDVKTVDAWLKHPGELIESGYTIQETASQVFNDLKFSYIVRKNTLKPQLESLIKESAIIYLVLALVGLLMALFVANRTYRPIQKTVNQFKGYAQPVGKDEIAFIQSTADGILQINESLRQTIHCNKLPLKKKWIRDLLFGLVPKSHIRHELDTYGLTGISGPLTVAIVQVVNEVDWEEKYSKTPLFEIMSQVSQLMEQLLPSEMTCETLDLDYRRFVLLFCENDIRKTKLLLTNILGDIGQNFGIDLVAAVGGPVNRIEDAEKSFNEALNIMEYRYVLDRRAVITADELKDLRNTGYYYPLELERDLIAGVVAGNTDKTLSVLNKLLEENLDIRRLSIEKRSQFIIAIVSTVNRINQQARMLKSGLSAADEKLYPKLMRCSDLQQLKHAIFGLFTGMIERIINENGEIDESTASQMLKFIHQYYNKDLSLNDIAQQFNFSPSYVSTLFKNYTGENFRDYLNNYRVKKAKEIMNGKPNIKIQDVALMVGCNNANTFIRMFKRYEGVSPGQYGKV